MIEENILNRPVAALMQNYAFKENWKSTADNAGRRPL